MAEQPPAMPHLSALDPQEQERAVEVLAARAVVAWDRSAGRASTPDDIALAATPLPPQVEAEVVEVQRWSRAAGR